MLFRNRPTLRVKWMEVKHGWAARACWHLTASRVNKDADGLDLPGLLDRIEKEMPKTKPEVQWTMNNTLMAIGIRHAAHGDPLLCPFAASMRGAPTSCR